MYKNSNIFHSIANQYNPSTIIEGRKSYNDQAYIITNVNGAGTTLSTIQNNIITPGVSILYEAKIQLQQINSSTMFIVNFEIENFRFSKLVSLKASKFTLPVPIWIGEREIDEIRGKNLFELLDAKNFEEAFSNGIIHLHTQGDSSIIVSNNDHDFNLTPMNFAKNPFINDFYSMLPFLILYFKDENIFEAQYHILTSCVNSI